MVTSESAPTTAYLVRHGATNDNLEGRFQRYDVPLSREGREQVRHLAARLGGLGSRPAHIYASDLLRTRETAGIIEERLPVPVSTTPHLRELDAGDWKGMLRSEVDAAWPGAFQEWLKAGGVTRLPGKEGESVADVVRRSHAFFRDAVAAHRGDSFVVVSHGWTLAILIASVVGWDVTEAFQGRRFRLANTALSVVRIGNDDAAACELLGCTTHLPNDPSTVPTQDGRASDRSALPDGTGTPRAP